MIPLETMEKKYSQYTRHEITLKLRLREVDNSISRLRPDEKETLDRLLKLRHVVANNIEGKKKKVKRKVYKADRKRFFLSV